MTGAVMRGDGRSITQVPSRGCGEGARQRKRHRDEEYENSAQCPRHEDGSVRNAVGRNEGEKRPHDHARALASDEGPKRRAPSGQPGPNAQEWWWIKIIIELTVSGGRTPLPLVPAVPLDPFRPGSTHVVQLRPIAVHQPRDEFSK